MSKNLTVKEYDALNNKEIVKLISTRFDLPVRDYMNSIEYAYDILYKLEDMGYMVDRMANASSKSYIINTINMEDGRTASGTTGFQYPKLKFTSQAICFIALLTVKAIVPTEEELSRMS